jgi:hypothetical protein
MLAVSFLFAGIVPGITIGGILPVDGIVSCIPDVACNPAFAGVRAVAGIAR